MTRRDSVATHWSIALWLIAQLLALGAAAARIPLWARVPPAVEHLSLVMMIATQIGAASLLFPNLVRRKSTVLIAIATGWPLAQLASSLADAGTAQLLISEAYVSFWLLTLHVWATVLRGMTADLMGAAIATMLSFGGPLLVYFRADFGDSSQIVSWPKQEMFGPIMGAISQLIPQQVALDAWIFPTVLFVIGALLKLQIARKNRVKQADSPAAVR